MVNLHKNKKFHMHHLRPDLHHLFDLSNTQRIEFIQMDHWVRHTRANHVLNALEDLFLRPRIPRMSGYLVIGDVGNGKSTLLREFSNLHPPVDDPNAECLQMPVLLLECPPEPDEKYFYNSILAKLGLPLKPSARADEKHRQVKTVLSRVGTRVLVVDEIHNLLAGSISRRSKFLNTLKYINNDFQLPIVAAGIDNALNVFTSEPQMQSRLEPIFLPVWQDNKDFWALLATFESLLPLRKPSDLQQEALSGEILYLSEGTIGEVVALLRKAAITAIKTGSECISLKGIKSLGFIRPSLRRKRDGGSLPDDSSGGDDPRPDTGLPN